MDQRLSVRQVSKILQMEVKILRLWEKEFAEYLQSSTEPMEHGTFSPSEVEILGKIKDLIYEEKYTIPGAKRRLELDRLTSIPLGADNSFKDTVVSMFTAIMGELQAARAESKKLAVEVEKLRLERNAMESRLWEEQNKSLVELFRTRVLKQNDLGS